MIQGRNPPSITGGVQVFDLTMDNLEDQDELNRRLRKTGAPKIGTTSSEDRVTTTEMPAEASQDHRLAP